MNAAPLDSPRLAPVLALLRKRGGNGATTQELQQLTNSMAPATDVAEIRSHGLQVTCLYEGKTDGGRKVYRYVLHGTHGEPQAAGKATGGDLFPHVGKQPMGAGTI